MSFDDGHRSARYSTAREGGEPRTIEEAGACHESDFPLIQRSVGDLFAFSRSKFYVCAILEADVTKARQLISGHATATGEVVSFTAWVAKCLAQAISEFPAANSYRRGSRRILTFDEVDVLTVVEKEIGVDRRPLPYVIRRANRKSLADIHHEIRSAQRLPVHDEAQAIHEQTSRDQRSWLTRLANPFLLPTFIRRLYWNGFRNDPFKVKRMMGTTGITSVGMFTRSGGWPIVPGVHTVDLAIGGIAEKPGVIGGQIAIREFLDLSLQIDHEMVDGAPAARFASRLVDLLEEAFSLPGVDHGHPTTTSPVAS